MALEDHLFRNEDLKKYSQILFIWRNAPTVVIGRNQNPWKECHLHEMELRGVTLSRRSSGGGAVYQDLGNTNFTFLSEMKNHNKNTNSEIICKALLEYGIVAEPSGRNDILVDNLKISGSAYKYSGDRALHHGTLLIDVDMNSLDRYLNPNKAKLQSKGVASVKSRVTNLRSLNPKINHEDLSQKLISQFQERYQGTADVEELDLSQLQKIPSLRETYLQLMVWQLFHFQLIVSLIGTGLAVAFW